MGHGQNNQVPSSNILICVAVDNFSIRVERDGKTHAITVSREKMRAKHLGDLQLHMTS
jgi:hypothetical protein